MGKIFNYVLNSAIASTAGAATAGEHFYIDWSYLPNTPYKVSFTYMSANLVPLNTTAANVYIDLGQGSTVMIASSNTNGVATVGKTYRAIFLGNLEVRTFSSASGNIQAYLYAATTTNPPIYINSRPLNNDVYVEIHSNTTNIETDYSPNSGQYTLILSLECQ